MCEEQWRNTRWSCKQSSWNTITFSPPCIISGLKWRIVRRKVMIMILLLAPSPSSSPQIFLIFFSLKKTFLFQRERVAPLMELPFHPAIIFHSDILKGDKAISFRIQKPLSKMHSQKIAKSHLHNLVIVLDMKFFNTIGSCYKVIENYKIKIKLSSWKNNFFGVLKIFF